MNPLEVLPWHEPLWARISASRRAGRMPQALLLAGPRGLGKTLFAHRLAACLLCEKGGADPCGVCGGCRQFAAGSHPSFFRLRPEEDKRDISIDAVREMSERLALTSYHGGAKVALIEPADALNQNGVNALLKTIEEPTAGSHLLLLTGRPMALAPTLRSRCQILRFGVPPSSQALAWLRQRAPQADEASLTHAHGAPLRALDLIESGAQQQQAEWAKRLLAVAAGQESPLALASSIDKASAQVFLDWLLTWSVQQLKVRLGAVPEIGRARSGAILSVSALDRLAQDSLNASRRLRGNAAVQLTLESVIIDFWQLCRSTVQEPQT